MQEKHWKYEQSSASTTWDIDNVPKGADGAHITHVKTPDGRTLKDFGQVDAPYGIQLSFGVEAESGVAYGTYYVEEVDHVVGNGGVVNINVTQNNGGAASEPYNFPESEGGQD